jgi:hypothetical protein
MDEISMIDCINFYNISKQMCIALNNEFNPFEGKNVIFAGDFAQLPPVSVGRALYSQTVSSVIHTTMSHVEQKAALGKAIWHQFTTAVILRENMRQRSQSPEDAKFRTLLENLQYKSCSDEDIQFLHGCVTGKSGDHQSQWRDSQFRNVSVITSFNATRDKLSERGAMQFANETNQTLSNFYSVDKYSATSQGVKITKKSQKNQIDPICNTDRLLSQDQYIFWSLPPNSTNNHPGKLSLCKGMPVMIKKNKATECGVTNGAEGVVVG